MAINKTLAIVLHTRKQGETSKLVTMLTEQYGKQEVIAKGARSIKSRYSGLLEPCTHIAIVFYRNENRSFQYLSQADMIERFPDMHEQLGKLALAAIPCEIINRSEKEGHKNPQLFHLLLETLQALEERDSGLKNIIRCFHLRFLEISGLEPALDCCALCGYTGTDRSFVFALDNGVYSCQQCGLLTEYTIKLTGQILECLRWLRQVDMKTAAGVKIPAAIGIELDSVLIRYLRFHVEGLMILKSLDYLEQLQSRLNNNK